MSLEKPVSKDTALEHIRFRATDAAVAMYEKAFGKNTENAEAVQEIFNEFFREQVEKTELVFSEKYDVSYLHCEITAGNFAKRLYEKMRGPLPDLKFGGS